ncbi:MAG: hypothetical protein PF574_03940 [Candidatus Delongbacteria bacterium]|jgi:hypothetical protein|nr:hypothetical protein [Candidatus Delongbacteria bacterium]
MTTDKYDPDLAQKYGADDYGMRKYVMADNEIHNKIAKINI